MKTPEEIAEVLLAADHYPPLCARLAEKTMICGTAVITQEEAMDIVAEALAMRIVDAIWPVNLMGVVK